MPNISSIEYDDINQFFAFNEFKHFNIYKTIHLLLHSLIITVASVILNIILMIHIDALEELIRFIADLNGFEVLMSDPMSFVNSSTFLVTDVDIIDIGILICLWALFSSANKNIFNKKLFKIFRIFNIISFLKIFSSFLNLFLLPYIIVLLKHFKVEIQSNFLLSLIFLLLFLCGFLSLLFHYKKIKTIKKFKKGIPKDIIKIKELKEMVSINKISFVINILLFVLFMILPIAINSYINNYWEFSRYIKDEELAFYNRCMPIVTAVSIFIGINFPMFALENLIHNKIIKKFDHFLENRKIVKINYVPKD